MSNVNSLSSQTQIEPWRRLWLPTDTWDKFRGIDEDFLSDHGGKGGIENSWSDSLPGISFLSGFGEVPFLVLLGRPGSGKSHELRQAEKDSSLGGPSVLIEGKEIGATHPAIYLQTVLASRLDQPTRLIIDGLEEILPANPAFVTQLKAWFRLNLDEHGRPRHRLAISCRWADWPEPQIANLATLWPTAEPKNLVLAPLRHVDAVETLQRRLGEEQANAFWRHLRELRLFPVACWPQGFMALLQQFEDSGFQSVAVSHADAIRDQVIKHCRLADSPDDPVRWQQSAPGAEWRQRVAGRIAATMIVSGRAHLALDETVLPASENALGPTELGSTEELWEGRWMSPKLEDLDAVVHRTRLMRRLGGTNRWVFQSQVHQEWLAAEWLAARKLDFPRLKQIFGSETEGQWMVAPTMRATAAWLARFDPEFRKQVLFHDPLTLLRMDGACLPENERHDVVEALLGATDRIRVLDPGIRHAHLPSLKHGGLAKQLERWLTDPNVTDATKHLAIEIAEKTDLNEISNILWQIYPDASKRLRPEIGGALLRLAKDGQDDSWRAVLSGKIPCDAHGNLLGAAIDVMVIESQKVPVREVLRYVLPERHFEVFGLYESVVRSLHERLTVEDLPAVFACLAEYPKAIEDSLSRAKDFNDAAVCLAFREFARPQVAVALVSYWHACLRGHVIPKRDHGGLWKDLESESAIDDERRKFIAALVTHPDFERHREHGWVSTSDYLLEDRDFEWCLDQMGTELPENEWRFALLASVMIWRADLSGRLGDKLNAFWEKSSSLRGMLPNPTDGESIAQAILRIAAENQAQRDAKANHSNKRQEQREQAHRERMAREIENCRQAHDRGEMVWPGAFRILMFRESQATSGIVSFEPISRIGPGDEWIREAAVRFITAAPSRADFGTDYGLHGLLALAACIGELDSDGPLRQSVENHWLVHFVPLLCNHGLGDTPAGISNERFAELFSAAFTRAFGEFCRSSYRSDGSLSELHQLAKIQIPGSVSELKSILTGEPLRPAGFFTGLWFLSRADEEAAIEVALHWLTDLGDVMPRDAAASLFGAAAVLVNGRLSGEIADHLANTRLVSDGIRAAASRLAWHEREMDFSGWPDHALKTLADACWEAFPITDRHRGNRGTFEYHGVTDEDHAMEFRDRLSSAAWSRGIDVVIPTAVDGENDDEAEQRRHMIDWHRHANLQTRVGVDWTPVQPVHFLKLANRPHARLARNQDELLSAVIESLARWENELINGGVWHHLWNHELSKPEKTIAREIRSWLKRDLEIPVECQIELASEDRSDLLVETLPTDGVSPALHVVIELKKLRASNAKERRTAMKSQLVDRYLSEREHEGWTHGLYVIAWTPKPKSRADSKEAIEQARLELNKQAEELSVLSFTVKALVIDARHRG
jgi:hypothetical protein